MAQFTWDDPSVIISSTLLTGKSTSVLTINNMVTLFICAKLWDMQWIKEQMGPHHEVSGT